MSTEKQQHEKITGYRTLTAGEIDIMNEIKAKAEEVAAIFVRLETASALPGGVEPDKRWLAIARTDMQKAFMAMARAVARPTTF